jgi:hypothetical protein
MEKWKRKYRRNNAKKMEEQMEKSDSGERAKRASNL